MAGTSSSFNAADFRTQIRAAMAMGAPSDTAMQTTWIFDEQARYNPEDLIDDPYDWGATPISDIEASTITVPSAVQFAPGGVEGTPAGEFDATRATITLLDEDYEQIKEANAVMISGNIYDFDPPGWIDQGLFDVSVYQIHVSARG